VSSIVRKTTLEQAESRSRARLFTRFKATLDYAGYQGEPGYIQEWFENYMQDIPAFEAILAKDEARIKEETHA
jgi:hypothetical protein